MGESMENYSVRKQVKNSFETNKERLKYPKKSKLNLEKNVEKNEEITEGDQSNKCMKHKLSSD